MVKENKEEIALIQNCLRDLVCNLANLQAEVSELINRVTKLEQWKERHDL